MLSIGPARFTGLDRGSRLFCTGPQSDAFIGSDRRSCRDLELGRQLATAARGVQSHSDFKVSGSQDDQGQYKDIRGTYDGKPVQIHMDRIPQYAKVGGLTIETDPHYHIGGNFAGTTLNLDVVPEDVIAKAGGINIQTGTIYHVSGHEGSQAIKTDIQSQPEVSQVGGLAVETGRKTDVRSASGQGPTFSLETKDKVENSIETDAWHHASSTQAGDTFEADVHGLNGGEDIAVDGAVPKNDLALLVALRPFET